MIRKYEIDDLRDSMYDMSWGVNVIMSDTRYGRKSVRIAEFGKQEDAQIFIDTRKKVEESAE